MAQEIGADDAASVGDVHEACGGNPQEEIEMDLHNNQAGRELAIGDCDCRAGCLQALEDGQLIVMPPETWWDP
ncbi:MAG: hypothetical protein JW704_08885 [Anaerolineaceae bacterium]|nr:hypothetical protein [Anaerolineaceae bacterium]